MAEKNYRIQQLPPTLGIKDNDVRMFLDALANAWDHRSGNTDSGSPDRFITAGEFKSMANNAIVEALSNSLPGGSNPPGTAGPVSGVLDSIADYIRKSLLFQILGTEYPSIDISALQQRIADAYDGARTLFLEERSQRETADTAMTSSITAQASRINDAEAAIVAEGSTRVNKDNAIAEAINTMWAKIGGNTAVIQDGQLAAISPNAAQATKWDQVQVAVRDPNTGLPSSTSIKQELTSYANAADGKFNSLYTVRAQITAGGKTVVGGFGLAAVGGAAGAEGPRISFGVRADDFFVASTSSNDEVQPFTVLTVPTMVNGALRQPGIYVTDATIGNASVDTLRIKGNSVTVPVGASGSGGVPGLTIDLPYGGSIMVCVTANALPPPGENSAATMNLAAVCNGQSGPSVGISMAGANPGITAFSGSACAIGKFDVGPGTHTVGGSVSISAGVRNIGACGIFAIGVMR